VELPEITRRQRHILSLDQIGQLLWEMSYPEREIAIFAMQTDLNVSETCALQWKYLNLSDITRPIGQEVVPARTVAVRSQSYRGELTDVTGGRRRLVRVPALLRSILRELRNRRQFTGPNDFVLVSRHGTPIHAENIAARRLKSLGKSLHLPWLSWSTFHHTRADLKLELDRHLNKEFEVIPAPIRAATAHGIRFRGTNSTKDLRTKEPGDDHIL
jgi:hypothetical protein